MLFRDADQPPLDASLQTERIVIDEELAQLKEASYDAIVSSLCLHWVNDLPGCLTSIRKALKPDSVFMGTLFGCVHCEKTMLHIFYVHVRNWNELSDVPFRTIFCSRKSRF